MTTEMLLILIIAMYCWLWRMESREAQEEAMVRQMIREARKSKPRMERNPARFGTVGYRVVR